MPPWEAMEPLVWRGAFSKNTSPFREHKRPSEKKDTLSLGLECCCYLLECVTAVLIVGLTKLPV